MDASSNAFIGGLPAPLQKLACLYARAGQFATDHLWPLLQVGIRFWMAKIFFLSGLTKIDSWENTLFLFEYEYMVPVLPIPFAAASATAIELLAPVFLLFGLFGRLAALPMLIMSFVIQFHLGAANPAYNNVEHYYWMLLLGCLILTGPGKFSLDAFLAKKADYQGTV